MWGKGLLLQLAKCRVALNTTITTGRTVGRQTFCYIIGEQYIAVLSHKHFILMFYTWPTTDVTTTATNTAATTTTAIECYESASVSCTAVWRKEFFDVIHSVTDYMRLYCTLLTLAFLMTTTNVTFMICTLCNCLVRYLGSSYSVCADHGRHEQVVRYVSHIFYTHSAVVVSYLTVLLTR